MSNNNELWMVYDNEEGIVYIGHNKQDAIKTYEDYKQYKKECVENYDDFWGNEQVILAKIVRNFESYDTGIPVISRETGEDTGDTYWDFKETIAEE